MRWQDGRYIYTDEDPKEWQRFDGMYYTNLDKYSQGGALPADFTQQAKAAVEGSANAPGTAGTIFATTHDNQMSPGGQRITQVSNGVPITVSSDFMTGGLVDPNAYQMNDITAQGLQNYQDLNAEYAARGNHSFDADYRYAKDAPTVEGSTYNADWTYDPETIAYNDAKAAKIRGVADLTADTLSQHQINSAFKGTDAQLDQANAAYGAADGGQLRQLTEQQILSAALGQSPSAAEALYGKAQTDYAGAAGQAGVDYSAASRAARAQYDLAQQNYAYSAQQAGQDYATQNRNAQDAFARQQMSLAAGARGDASGLALLNAQNQTATGQAQLAQQALDAYQKQQLSLQQGLSQANYGAGQLQQQQLEAYQRQQLAAQQGLAQGSYGAAATRADEMANARNLLGNYGEQMRGQDISVAQGFGNLANTQQISDQQRLAASQHVNDATTAANQFNLATQADVNKQQALLNTQVSQSNAANSLAAGTQDAANLMQNNQFNSTQFNNEHQFNAQQNQAADTTNAANSLANSQYNAGQYNSVQQQNESRALQSQISNDAALQANNAAITNIGQNQQTQDITLQRDQSTNVQQSLDRAANIVTNNATNNLGYEQLHAQQESANQAAAIGLLSTTAAAIAGSGSNSKSSDERLKHITNTSAKVPDFSDAQSEDFTYYDPTIEGNDSRQHYGQPMADQLPKGSVYVGPDGYKRVRIDDLALQLAAAVGQLQREQRK